MNLRLTILGSGTSHGVPMIGCECAVCRSDDPRDRRTRPSALFEVNGRFILVDTSPELRLQCLACDVRRVDALFYTHHHADHVTGLDDVRIFNYRSGGALPVYGSAATLEHLQKMFRYAFVDDPTYPSAKPQLRPMPIAGPFTLFDARIIPVPYFHGPLPVLGVHIGDVAYCPDCNRMPEESRELLRDLDTLVLDGLRRRPHPTHFNLEQAVEEAQRIGAARTYLTHIAHELPHAQTNAELPRGIELAYDGLVIESG